VDAKLSDALAMLTIVGLALAGAVVVVLLRAA
jgi:hypothetical protein